MVAISFRPQFSSSHDTSCKEQLPLRLHWSASATQDLHRHFRHPILLETQRGGPRRRQADSTLPWAAYHRSFRRTWTNRANKPHHQRQVLVEDEEIQPICDSAPKTALSEANRHYLEVQRQARQHFAAIRRWVQENYWKIKPLVLLNR